MKTYKIIRVRNSALSAFYSILSEKDKVAYEMDITPFQGLSNLWIGPQLNFAFRTSEDKTVLQLFCTAQYPLGPLLLKENANTLYKVRGFDTVTHKLNLFDKGDKLLYKVRLGPDNALIISNPNKEEVGRIRETEPNKKVEITFDETKIENQVILVLCVFVRPMLR